MSWTQIEKQTAVYRRLPTEKNAAALDRLLRRSQPFLEKLTAYFVQTIPDFSDASVAFALSENGNYSTSSCVYLAEQNQFELNPVRIAELWESWQAIELPDGYDAEKQSKGEREVNRLMAFRKEMGKLPSQWFAMLMLYQEMARVLNERNPEPMRAGQKPVHGEEELEYTRLLWGFSHVESLYSRLMGGNLRADTGICWFEFTWAIGR